MPFETLSPNIIISIVPCNSCENVSFARKVCSDPPTTCKRMDQPLLSSINMTHISLKYPTEGFFMNIHRSVLKNILIIRGKKRIINITFFRPHSSLLFASLKSVVCPTAPGSNSKLTLKLKINLQTGCKVK